MFHCFITRFIEFAQHAVEVENHWKEFAMESTKEFRILVKKKRDLERHILELDGVIGTRGKSVGIRTDYREDVEALKRTQYLQKVRDLWTGIAEFHSMQEPQRKIVDTVLMGEANKYHIDVSDVEPRVPDMLLRDSEREIRKRNIEDTYCGGKVNLLSLIQLWNLSLSKIKEQIYQEPLSSLEDYCPTVRSAFHSHNAHLSNAKALRASIEETMPTMKESIKELKLECYRSLEKKPSKASQGPVVFNLGLVPPTPPVSFAPADTPMAQRITSFQDSLKLSPETVSTPDVIQAWTKSARTKQLYGEKESLFKPRNKKEESSRLPRPIQYCHVTETLNTRAVTFQSTEKKKKPSSQPCVEKSLPYSSHFTPRAKQVEKHQSLKPKVQNILADQIADAVAIQETTSSSLSSSSSSSRATSPQLQALEDPAGALGQGAFQPRDRIPRTPAKSDDGHKRAKVETFTRQNAETKTGRFLQAILDESTETTTSNPVRGGLSRVIPPRDVSGLLYSEGKISSSPLRTSLVHEKTPELDTSSLRPFSSLNHSSDKPAYSTSAHESFNRIMFQPTPKSVTKSLFEESPPQEMPQQQNEAAPAHPTTHLTAMSDEMPLSMRQSPSLEFWLRPQGGNLDVDVHEEATSPRTDLSPDETPVESGNSSFNGIEFFSRFSEKIPLNTDKARSVVRTSQSHNTSGARASTKLGAIVTHTAFQNVPSSASEVDTSALIQRLNKIKLTQLSLSSPRLAPSGLSESHAADSSTSEQDERRGQTPDSSLFASRLDQIKQAQKSQQVTPGANTDGDLSNSRTSEPALLTPLTPSSRGTPDEDGIKNGFANFSFNSPQPITSLSGSPSSPKDIDLSVQTSLRLKNGGEFLSLLQETPRMFEGLFEDIPWETATPSLPERTSHKVEDDLAEKSSILPGMTGVHSSSPYNISTPLLLNSVRMPDGASQISSSKHTFSGLGGFTLQDETDLSRRHDLPSPFSYRGSVASHVTSPRPHESQHSPVVGQLIDFE